MSRNNDRGKPAQSLVAVHERVVSNQRFEESGRLAVEGRVGVLSPQAGTRPVGDRVQQANITDRAHPEIVDQGQEIFEREVIGHCPSTDVRGALESTSRLMVVTSLAYPESASSSGKQVVTGVRVRRRS